MTVGAGLSNQSPWTPGSRSGTCCFSLADDGFQFRLRTESLAGAGLRGEFQFTRHLGNDLLDFTVPLSDWQTVRRISDASNARQLLFGFEGNESCGGNDGVDRSSAGRGRFAEGGSDSDMYVTPPGTVSTGFIDTSGRVTRFILGRARQSKPTSLPVTHK